MNTRLARRLAGLYPPEWQSRYGEEFQSFLETHPSNLGTIFDVVGGAMRERVLSLGRFKMDRRQHSLVWMLYAYLAAIAAGINFYWTVDDTPLAKAIGNQSQLFGSWTMVGVGSVLALAAVAMIGIPVLMTMIRKAFASRRWGVLHLVAVPPCAAFVTIAWMVAATSLSGGHWVPTPWDVTGSWAAPSNWPPLPTRWALGSVTFVLMTAGLIASAASVAEAIRRSDLSRHRQVWFTTSSMLLAGSVAAMALGVLAWGLFVEQFAPSEFHVRNGGLFSSTNFVSWIASCVVFLAAAVMAIKGARSVLALRTE